MIHFICIVVLEVFKTTNVVANCFPPVLLRPELYVEVPLSPLNTPDKHVVLVDM